MSFYDEMDDVVNELLQEFGQLIPITHQPKNLRYDVTTSSTQDPTDTFPEIIEQSYGVIVEWDMNSMIRGGVQELDATLIETTDKRLIIAARTLTSFGIGDTITANGISYTVKQPFKEINPANRVLAYDCNVRS